MRLAPGQRGFTMLEAIVTIALVGGVAVAALGVAAYAGHEADAGESASLDAFALHNARAQIEALVRYDRNALTSLGPATWTVLPPRKPARLQRWLPEDRVTLTLQASAIAVSGSGATLTLTLQDPLHGTLVQTTSVAADLPKDCDPPLQRVVC